MCDLLKQQQVDDNNNNSKNSSSSDDDDKKDNDEICAFWEDSNERTFVVEIPADKQRQQHP